MVEDKGEDVTATVINFPKDKIKSKWDYILEGLKLADQSLYAVEAELKRYENKHTLEILMIRKNIAIYRALFDKYKLDEERGS